MQQFIWNAISWSGYRFAVIVNSLKTVQCNVTKNGFFEKLLLYYIYKVENLQNITKAIFSLLKVLPNCRIISREWLREEIKRK